MTFRVALTFDAEHPDRPATDGNAEGLLDVLAAEGLRATIFIRGRWAEYPATARRIAEAGHLVGSHSFYHARMPLLTDAGIEADIRDAEEAIRAFAGVDPRPWFRCPFGAGADDPRVIDRIARLGYRDVHWNVTSEDWEPARNAADIVRIVVAGARLQGDGAVVLQHTWPDQTLGAIREIIGGLRDLGATFVTVDALPPLPRPPVAEASPNPA
ncbi:MAG TPA: polysaccharide deacetylase family protein [Candidatus Limnocylindrales bacterium]|nr:polysaccharide deacetylase family protein [Candidatus Limnocylindrales bacterium]